MPKKTIYGRCPKCKAKGELLVVCGTPGKEKFRCNRCYHNFGMDEL
jgi:transposase-like protein